VPQYRDFEEPFWRKEFPSLTRGLARADIVPFDKAGIRAHEAMRLMQLGVVPFGSALLSAVMSTDPELAAMDLAGLNPDMATLRRSVAAFRVHFEQVMRERHGVEVLAIYVYPAQVAFCNQPFKGLSDLSGRRVRISSPTQADLLRAFGAVPVQTEFAEVVAQMRSGNVDCAITGSMSGHAIGLHEVTTHVHHRAINWGLSMFGANRAAWQALPDEIRKVLQTALPKLEESIWQDADRQHREGTACNTGRGACSVGKTGRMTEVLTQPEDEQRLRDAFRSHVLPSWLERCGNACVPVWNRLLAPISGVEATTLPRSH
jgi:TRAP-type C4-dicarboxylate transport system substrate-binding protein